MAPLYLPLLPLFLAIFAYTGASDDLIHTACAHASYPNICLTTLSSYTGGPIDTPSDLARASVRVSLSRATKTSQYIVELKTQTKKRDKDNGPLSDCVEQIGDSVDELRMTLSELRNLRRGSGFKWRMSNAETWVSAALTNEYTCLDGFKEANGGKVREDLKSKIDNVAKVTSNALYFIDYLVKF